MQTGYKKPVDQTTESLPHFYILFFKVSLRVLFLKLLDGIYDTWEKQIILSLLQAFNVAARNQATTMNILYFFLYFFKYLFKYANLEY